MAGPPVAVVHACTRDGRGGSPTAVVIDDATLTDGDRHAITRGTGTSHTAFIDTGTADAPTVRFFTSAGELTNCGHGTIAAQAVLLHRSGAAERRGWQRTAGRTFATTAIRRGDGVEVWFDQGAVTLADGATGGIVAALGLRRADIPAGVRVASPGTPRLLVPVQDHATLRSIRPDFARLATECRRLGYLGCFVYALAPAASTAAARMFAPAIGVDEDIANANSAGCLAAHLLDTSGNGDIEVHQGDALNRPSSIFASATDTGSGIVASIGGVVDLAPIPGRPPGARAA
ncbi:PhzF family phenazine biosynthesis protein [Dactylosporangium aurantiacum]|uniref:PhzF family phenazine biosynthesis protein n=1 Tax=Dactylosporangium aurantiacum TaxID=35754 RepID=A0A9Q9MKM9_9ACTN|nr:PhzF family phenazine biosynthesis isomerase [Dactylosporangium aurantiacum]MDG6110366.1 PhzF family phenazine biosynthesis isomerase [Dactylosporangium aurantiacum]UWZ58135.1 PhzF family phenazine biosynthesis protein [Dactylosporangium aurantiacum]